MRPSGTIGPALAPYGRRTALWWAGRNRRERMLLAVLGALLAAVAFVGLVVRPLQAMRAADLIAIHTYDTIVARARAQPPGVGSPAIPRSGDIGEIIAASARPLGLDVRAVPESGGAQVQLRGVPYEAVIRWLADMDRTSAVRVRRLSLVRAAAPGTVDAAVLLVR